jgi:hypothetical protein
MKITAAAFIGARATRRDRSQMRELTELDPITVFDMLRFDCGGDSKKERMQCGVRIGMSTPDNRAAVPVDLV